ncbi:MAG: hypothetical protein GF346_07855 [Candidatus Eisenbacteria bacterium]|nr:hypothetical protein [Candidatus Latescibacterota bacterium]MBD3302347.1 hypothetical protein [Candidatus Eisenbacteria bacterium]
MTPRRPFLLLLLLPALLGLASSSRAQEEPTVFVFDYGTIGLDSLQVFSPSSVFRPLDMLGVRAGGRAWAMGGAYVAEARGLEAVSWNPAGLGWLERTDVMADLFWLRSSGTTSGFPDTFNIPEVSLVNVTRYEVNLKSNVRYNMLGGAFSTDLPGNLHMGGAISFRRYMDTAYPEEIIEDMTFQEGGSFPVTLAFDDSESGGVEAVAATIGLQVVPDLLSVGGNLNFLTGRLDAQQEQILATGGGQIPPGRRDIRFDYSGFSTDLGLQARFGDRGGLGVRFTPGYTLDVEGGSFYAQSLAPPGQPIVVVQARIADYEIDVPSLLTVGGVLDPLDWLTVTADYSIQSWQDAEVRYKEDRDEDADLPLQDVTSLNVGLEGRFFRIRDVELPLRIGYRRGPLSLAQLAPEGKIDGAHVLDFDWAGGEIDTQALSFGIGFLTGPLRYDLALDFLDYELEKFYFDAYYDPLVNPQSTIVKVDRRLNRIRLSATLQL